MKHAFFQTIMAMLLAIIMAPVALATETIQVVWGFNPGSTQANTLRQIIDVANKQQTEFKFEFTPRPGAGGYIAAKEVRDNPQTAVVGMSSSFIIRPLFERSNPVHDLNDYVPVLVQAHGAPLFFMSQKYSDIKDAIRAADLTIGVSGIGSISHLAAHELIKLNPRAEIVNFKNSIEAVTAAAGGHVDIAVAFYTDGKGLVDAGRAKILARTGSEQISGSATPNLDKLGAKTSLQLTANYAIFANKSMHPDRLHKIHAILGSAHNDATVRAMYVQDQLIALDLDLKQSQVWYDSQRSYWQSVTDTIKR
jgi:tripartite-type tricarboxylate transporter receptor subunit TctC